MIASNLVRAIALGCLAAALCGCAQEEPRAAGQRLYAQHSYAEAAGAFRAAIIDDPRDYKAYCYLGTAYMQINAPLQATEAFRAGLDVIEMSPKGRKDGYFHMRMMDGLAGAIAAGTNRDAEIDLLLQQARSGQSAPYYFILAKVERFRGDAELAADYYNRAILIDNRNFAMLKEDGLYLERLGQNDRAAGPLCRAYAINSNDSEVIAALWRIGIVPGPSLKEREDLVKPYFPEGPIDFGQVGQLPHKDKAQPAAATAEPDPPSAAPASGD